MQVAPNERVFYINHAEKRTTWVNPLTGRPSKLPNVDVDDNNPLPEGWDAKVHTDGRTFFINHYTRKTQWKDPREDAGNTIILL